MYLLSANAMCNDQQSRIPWLSGSSFFQNHVRRRKDYKTYWRALDKCGLWKYPVYQAKKVGPEDLGDAVRERMLNCVIEDASSRFPSPLGIPYMGHRRE